MPVKTIKSIFNFNPDSELDAEIRHLTIRNR